MTVIFPVSQSLCGQVVCPRMCMRSEHCQAGLARRRVLLGQLRSRRLLRRSCILYRIPAGWGGKS